jgi:hypothetical protein
MRYGTLKTEFFFATPFPNSIDPIHKLVLKKHAFGNSVAATRNNREFQSTSGHRKKQTKPLLTSLQSASEDWGPVSLGRAKVRTVQYILYVDLDTMDTRL